MSGSRAIVLSLSVRDADVVRQQLVQMGEQGERALQRLDAAAQRSASGGGVPALARSTREASVNTGRFGQAVGQAGFQIQDFAVQVQMGQNAMTAFGAQASQFLGVFGTGGAIAGAVLTVGLLAYQLLFARTSTDELAEAQKRLENATKAANDVFETEIERVARLDRTARAAVVSTSALAAASIRQQQAARAERMAELAPTVQQAEDARAIGGQETRIPESVQRRVAEFYRLQEEMRRAAEELERLDARSRGALTDPSARQRDQAEALRAQLDERYRIAQQYDERIRELRGLAAVGLFGSDELRQREAQARAQRDEQLSRLGRDDANVDGALERARQRSAAQFQAQTEQLLQSVQTPLERYERRIEEIQIIALRAREEGNPIPEEAIERATTAALLDFERLERGTKRMGEEAGRTSDFARNLGFSFSSAFEDAILKGQRFSQVLQGIAEDIARIIIRSAVTTPLANAVGAGIGQLGTSFGNYFADPTLGGKTGGSINVSFGGARAEGGPVSGGMAYLVGERGPEIVVPRSSGTVIPNDRIGGPSISQTFNIDARGADASMVPRLRAEMVAIARASNAELLDSIQRGGSAARIVGRRA